MSEFTQNGGLEIWTIYDHPKDYPDHFVARKFIYDQPTDLALEFASLENVRRYMMEMGLVCIARHPTDDPCIVECWL